MTTSKRTSRKSAEKSTAADEAAFIDARQIDLFIPEIASWPLKDDLASMEIPFFSLSKGGDMETREYRSGNRSVKIIPSGEGAATVFDKDLLLYASSHIIDARNRGVPVSRSILVDSYDFLISTDRSDGGNAFANLIGMLRRLRGTTIETNVPTGNKVQTDGFSFIENYTVLSQRTRMEKVKGKETGREVTLVQSFKFTMSEWLWNGLMNFEVLTLDKRYFKLTKPIERRLYELARKHCGDKAVYKIGIDLLGEKLGYQRERFKLRDDLRQIIAADSLPEYRIGLASTKKPEQVIVYTRDAAKLAKHIMADGLYEWWDSIERKR